MKEDKMLPFQLITVGKPICDEWVKETNLDAYAKFDFYTVMGQLVMYIDRPTNEEIKVVESGDVKLGMTIIHHSNMPSHSVLFLTWQFGKSLAFETPYNIHLRLEDFEFTIPEEGYGYGIQCILVDSSNGIVEAIRVLGTSKEWTDDFRNINMDQKDKVFNKEIYTKFVDLVYREYSTQDIIKMCKIYDIKWR